MTTTASIPTPVPQAAARLRVPEWFVALMYHNICPDDALYPELSPSATSYFVTERNFAAQLDDINRDGGYCLTWQALNAFYDLAASAGRADTAAQRAVLLTFDDGWKGAVELGGPVLEGHRSQSIIFVTTDFLGRRHFLSRNDLTKLNPGRFRVGSHARTHRMLSLLPEP